MSKLIDLLGKKFGRLIVVGRAKNDKPYSTSLWTCQCDCGNTINAQSLSLRSNRTKSCGCLRKEITSSMAKKGGLPTGESVRNSKYTVAKKKARDRGLCFSLSKEEYHKLIESNCYYCGSPPRQTYHGTKGLKPSTYLCGGIDRKDSKVGYVLENCLPSCRTCNVAKMEMGIGQFMSWIKRVHDYSLSRLIAA